MKPHSAPSWHGAPRYSRWLRSRVLPVVQKEGDGAMAMDDATRYARTRPSGRNEEMRWCYIPDGQNNRGKKMKNQTPHLQVRQASGQLIGFFDGEYVTSNTGQTLYRVDGDEIYTPGNNAKHIGYLEGNVASTVTGEPLFTLSK